MPAVLGYPQIACASEMAAIRAADVDMVKEAATPPSCQSADQAEGTCPLAARDAWVPKLREGDGIVWF